VRRDLGEVGELARVGVVVVEFAAGFAFVPLGVAPARGAQAVAGEATGRRRDVRSGGWRGGFGFTFAFAGGGGRGGGGAAHHLRERPAAAGEGRIAQHGGEALALEIGGGFDAGEFGEGGEEVELADRGCGDGFWFRNAGGDDQEGHAGAFLKQALLLPEAVLAGEVAVVAREDDDRALGEAEAVEGVDDAADLGVHERDARVVALQRFAALVVGHVVLLAFVAGETGRRNIGLIGFDVGDDPHFLAWVVAEVGIFRRDVGCVRAVKTDSEEERALAGFREAFEDPLGVGGEHGIGVVRVAFRRGIPAERAAELTGGERGDFRFFLGAVDAGGVEREFP